MNGNFKGGTLLIVIALLVGYMGVSGKYRCFSFFLSCLNSDPNTCGCGGGTEDGGGPIIVTPGGAEYNSDPSRKGSSTNPYVLPNNFAQILPLDRLVPAGFI